MNYTIALIRGDGIGPEIVGSAVRVLEKVGQKFGHTFTFRDYLMGGCAIDACGTPLPEETVQGCLASDSVLLGAVGGPKWDKNPAALRPEKGLLGIRAALGLYTNLRPAKLYPALAEECPLRADIVAKGFDLLIVRELTGGIYFGERGRREGKYGPEAYDTEAYSVMEIERIARVAFETAKKRGGKLVSIDKANVLAPHWGGIPGSRPFGHAGGQRRHAARALPFPVRRGRHLQHVRRYPLGRSLANHRFHRPSALRLPRGRHTRPV